MSSLGNAGSERQDMQANYARWSQLRAQLGGDAIQNEEFITLSQTLQQHARQRAAALEQQPYGGGVASTGMPMPSNGMPPAGHTGPQGINMNRAPSMAPMPGNIPPNGPQKLGPGGLPTQGMGNSRTMSMMSPSTSHQQGMPGPPLQASQPSNMSSVSGNMGPQMSVSGINVPGGLPEGGIPGGMQGMMPPQYAGSVARGPTQRPPSRAVMESKDKKKPEPRPSESKRRSTQVQQQTTISQAAQQADEAAQQDSLMWLNMDQLGGDLNLDSTGLFEGDPNSNDPFLYSGLYPQGGDGDDAGFMDVLNDYGTNMTYPEPISIPPQAPEPVAPTTSVSPQLSSRKGSIDHSGSLMHPSPAISHRSFSQGTPHSTPQVPQQHTPSTPAVARTPVPPMGPQTHDNDLNISVNNQGAQGTQAFSSQGPQTAQGLHAPPGNRRIDTSQGSQGPQGPTTDSQQPSPMGPGLSRKDQLLTADESAVLTLQEAAFRALHAGQGVPPNIRNALFGVSSVSQTLPRLSRPGPIVSTPQVKAEPKPAPKPRAKRAVKKDPPMQATQSQQPQLQYPQQQQPQSQQPQIGPGPHSQPGQPGQAFPFQGRPPPPANLPSTLPRQMPPQGPSIGSGPAVGQQGFHLNGMNGSQGPMGPSGQVDASAGSQGIVGSPRTSIAQENSREPPGSQRSSVTGMQGSVAGQSHTMQQISGKNTQNGLTAGSQPQPNSDNSMQQPQQQAALLRNPALQQQIPSSTVTPTDSAAAGSNIGSNIPQVQLKKQHLEQHHMEQELGLKRLKQQQWQAQQRQEEMFRERYTNGEENDVAFVVPGGADLSSSGRSRRLTSSSEDMALPNDGGLDMMNRFGFNRTVDPRSLLPKKLRFENFENHEEMLTIPALLPLGLNGQAMKVERNARVEAEYAEKRTELERLSTERGLSLDEEIELRRLRLVPYLRAVRGDVMTHVQYFNSVAIDRSNRVHFARMKRLTHQDAVLVERFVNEQALERRKTDNLALHERTAKILKHRESLREYNDKRQSQQQRLSSQIGQYHAFVEREERRKYERTAKQRLQLLRANDEEAYLKLIDQTKDARITHLLKQTNKFLAGLAKAVKSQQGDTSGITGEEEEGNVDQEGEDVREKIDYYEVAHRVKENVTQQPSMLVGGTLKDYQLKGLQWMVSLYNNNLNGILADEMGLGKTIQSIALITYLIEVKKVPGPYLVLVPLSTLTNWNIEFEHWAPSIRKVVYKGAPAARRLMHTQIRTLDFQVLLTTYEYVIKDRPLFGRIKWEHMIIDEGHRMKNAQSKLSSTLAQYYSSRYRLILTGTPLQNNLPELWALLNFVLPKIFNSVKSFEEWFNKPFAQTGSVDRIDLGEEEKLLIIRRLHKVLRPFLLRRLKKDVEQDLPDKVEKVIKCKKSALQTQLYRYMLEHNALLFGTGNGASAMKSLSNRIMQLRKLCNHPFVFEEVESVVNPGKLTNNLLWRVSGKFELLDRVLPKFMATGHRTLMFFQMTQIMDIMEDFLQLRGIKYLRLDGMTKSETRSDLLRKFNEPDSPYFCFLLSTRAGGLGLNLQSADTVIIYDTDWNPHQDLQAQDRAHRIGQTHEVRILRLITENSIEENILERAQGKLDIDGKVIQAGKFDNKSTAEEQEAFLRTLLEAEEAKGESKEDELEEPDDEDLNLSLARNEDERQLFQRIDEERIVKEQGSAHPRLFSEAELPEQYTSEHFERQVFFEAQRELVLDEGGHHLRQRRGTWGDIEEEQSLPSRKRTRIMGDSPSPVSTPQIPTTSAPVGAAAKGRRPGRKGRPPRVKETMTPEAREHLTDAGKRIVAQMKSITDQTDPTKPRHRIDIFMDLPSRQIYPDYYQVIGLPMCVNTILKRINSRYYQSFDQFANDFRIIFRNARWYNAEGSLVYEDACVLEREFEEIFNQNVGYNAPDYVDHLGDQPEKTKLPPQPHPQQEPQPEQHELAQQLDLPE